MFRPLPVFPRPHRRAAFAARLAVPLLLLSTIRCANLDSEFPVCTPGTFRCVGTVGLKCNGDGSGETVDTDCADEGKICTAQGCRLCLPSSQQCKGIDLLRCNGSGTGYLPQPVMTCDAAKGMICDKGSCINACTLATVNRSYVGCEYWAVDLDNAVVEIGSAAAQQFAVALSNPSALSASVKVVVNEAPHGKPPQLKTVATRTVKPQALEVILLPSREVDGSPAGQYNVGGGTAVTTSAYKIESTAPIIAYQFNPLSNVDVFSNDASILVPTAALSSDPQIKNGAPYVVMSWPQTIATTTDARTNFGVDLRAFLTLVGTRDGTTVKILLSTDTIGDKAKLVAPKKKGETLTFTLNQFDVLNLETGGFNADFTSTKIDASKPVAVFTGSEASDVPDFKDLTYRKCCADHMEQQLFPLTTLGKTFIALKTPSRTQALRDAGAVITPKTEKEYFRILSAGESVGVTTSLQSPYDNFSLGSGVFAQLKVDGDFTVQATGPVVVGQFVAGQEETGIPSSLPGGDPSFILLPPVEQFRKDYLFLTPNKYAFDFIMVAAPRKAKVVLDGRELKKGCNTKQGRKLCCGVTDVGSVRHAGATADTSYIAYKCQLSYPKIDGEKNPPNNLLSGEQNDGVHRLVANQKVGLVVYGFDAYVTYGYPGGTDLALINLK